MELQEMSEASYGEFAEERFYELITKAHGLGKLVTGINQVLNRMQLGQFGLVFLAGDSQFKYSIPVCLKCIEHSVFYHVFDSGEKFQTIVKAKVSVVMVEEHEDYKELYDLCKSAVEIVND